MDILKNIFEERVNKSILESKSIGYYPGYYEEMIKNNGAYQTAIRLVTDSDIQSGLKELNKLNRLDLSIESIMSEIQFRLLFRSEYIEAAEWRLKQVKSNTDTPGN